MIRRDLVKLAEQFKKLLERNRAIVTPTATGVQVQTKNGMAEYPYRSSVRGKDRNL